MQNTNIVLRSGEWNTSLEPKNIPREVTISSTALETDTDNLRMGPEMPSLPRSENIGSQSKVDVEHWNPYGHLTLVAMCSVRAP